MKTLTFSEGVIVALIASVVGSIGFFGLGLLLSNSIALQLTNLGLALAYLLYLLSRSQNKTGRITVLVTWFVITLLAGLWQPSWACLLILQIGFVWLIRSVYFHDGLLRTLADFGLNAFALIAALWALEQSGSIGLTLWSFFLVQALFVFLINAKSDSAWGNPGLSASADDFQHAYNAAQAAVRKLSSTNP